MKGSIERVRAVVNGDMPDRPPLFDLLRNDAVIEHFAAQHLTLDHVDEVVYAAFAPALDATRPSVRLPGEERTVTLDDGREQRHYRWTTWTAHRQYADADAYAQAKRKELDSIDPYAWGPDHEQAMTDMFARIADDRRRLGEVFYVPGIGGPALMGLYGEIGLEAFSYNLADCPDIIEAILESQTARAVTWAEHLPADHGIEAGFLGDDIAFKAGTLLNPAWLREHYFPRLARVIDVWHRQGVRVLFHSDGNLNEILDDLVDAGIDGLNPIEVLAGMNVGDIHRRHPHLFMAGGIDVSQLLPFGSPATIKEMVTRTIEAAGGRIMIGSSTELNNEVPLENYLALRDAVLEYT